jgi:hypothetical protein
MAAILLFFGACAVVLGTGSHDSSSSTTTTAHHPPTPDERFLYIVHRHIWDLDHPDGDAGLIRIGHDTCGALREGISREALIRQTGQGPGLSDSDSSWLITASAVAYCPEMVVPSDRWEDPK